MNRLPAALELPPPPPELARLSQRLGERIAAEIRRDGPMPFDRYMAMALYEPGLGYYVNGLHKFGLAGDFVTAPEQGGLFAAALARQIDEIAGALDDSYVILELGAGSGVLARDLLENLAVPPERYLILEPSAPLRQVQGETLAGLNAGLADRVEWITAPPETPFDGLVLANEVVDALPVAMFEMTGEGLREQRIGVNQSRLGWIPAPARPRLRQAFENIQGRLEYQLSEGYRSEICLDLPGWLATVTEPLRRGAVLLFDYGYPRPEYYLPARSSGTLVCHYRHRAHFDPFVWPGLTDLSAFVDFSAVADAGRD
ncbi:MAG: SAM-dependent methyltransferase, partial [Xanthomonadaceae bacterium]|nr:SAM-dependent methyltransferase [Xanthomonadaceae bacterium]